MERPVKRAKEAKNIALSAKQSEPTQPGRANAAKIQSHIDAEKLLQFIGSNNILSWIQDFYSEVTEWRKKGKRYEGKNKPNRTIIWKNGTWIGTDFTDKDNRSGDIITLLRKEKNISFPAALQTLAKEFNYQQTDTETKAPTRCKRKPQEAAKPLHPYQVNHDQNEHPNGPRISARWKIATGTDAAAALEAYPKKISTAYLAKYGVRPLRSVTFTNSKKRIESRTADPLFLIEGAEGNRKIYRPNAKKGKQSKQLTATYAGNYCFGFDQLPETCEHILITAGQNDTIAANELLNGLGIYAVCLWSESSVSYLPAELLQLLQDRCKAVFVAYDDDATGNKAAREIADRYNLQALRIPHRFLVNDICDALEVAPPAEIIQAFQQAISCPGGHTISGKLSENTSASNDLISFIEGNWKTQLKAPTGIGKTYWAFKVLLPRLIERGHQMIFVTPTQSLAEQTAFDDKLKINGATWPLIMQGSDDADFAYAGQSPAIIATYHSLHKIKALLPDAVLVVDESHHLINDASKGFCFTACNDVLEMMQQASRVLLISGTPHNLIERLGFRFFEVRQADTAPAFIHPRSIESGKLFESIFGHLEKLEFVNDSSLHAVLWDDKKQLLCLRDSLVSTGILKADQIAILDSDRKHEDAYKQILSNGKLPEKIRLILTTRLIGDGVNIYNQAGNIILAEIANEELFAQFPARFRNAEELHVYSYRKEKEGKEGATTAAAISAAYTAARAHLDVVKIYEPYAANESSTGHVGRLQFDDLAPIYKSRSGNYRISDALILFNEIRRRDNCTGTADFYERICEKYPHFHLDDAVSVEVSENETLSAAKKSHSRQKKKAEHQTKLKLKHDPETILAAVHNGCNYQLKKSIEAVAMPGAVDREAVEKFKTDNADIFEQKTFAPVAQFVKLRKIGLDNAAAADIVGKKNKNELAAFHDRLRYATIIYLLENAPEILTAKEIGQANHYLNLRNELEKYGTGGKTNKQLARILQPLCPGELTTNKAVAIAKKLFEVEDNSKCIEGKTTRVYSLKSRSGLEKVLDEIGMKKADFLAANLQNAGKAVNSILRKLLKINNFTELSIREINSVIISHGNKPAFSETQTAKKKA